ncbi:MAG: ImmA/IrrE family metallo-endopeptidase [Acidobacteria bacterium]|nr:ImmA/IrrE family metallo-endopeptidase [Acidobacteriota bacterium]
MDTELLPPTFKGRQYEIRAMGLRDFAGMRRDDDPLDPFALAHYAKLLVIDFDQIEGLSEEAREHLLGVGTNSWSGGTCSRPLPNGWRVVILNPRHGRARNNATLMEEVCHVFLGHKANRLSIVAQNRQGKTVARDYNEADEEAAYSVGAAALVPFAGLRKLVREGRNSNEIARHFNVSRELVEYRLKVSRLWSDYRARQERRIAERYAAGVAPRDAGPEGDALTRADDRSGAGSRADDAAARRRVTSVSQSRARGNGRHDGAR